jgi:hypothetical protein
MPGRSLRGRHPDLNRLLYEEAVSRGVDYARHPMGSECVARPFELVATATELTPGLAMVALALSQPAAGDDEERQEGLRLTRAISAGLVRLAHWAREVHARDVGYRTEAWIEQALALSGYLCNEQHADPACVSEQLDEAAAHLADVICGLHTDRLSVPDMLSHAQGAWLATYRTAREATLSR